MNNYNWKKAKAIEKKFVENHKDILQLPGIYLWTRYDPEINKTYFYVGQAKNMLRRRFDYEKVLTGLAWPTRHFEASLKRHKDWHWELIEYCDDSKLDLLEQYWIKKYMKKDNYITRNEMLTGFDTVKTNAHRIGKIKKEYEESIQKSLKNLQIVNVKDKAINISVAFNKDGKVNQRSLNAFRTLLERLGLNE